MAMGAIRARNSMDEAAGWLAPLGGSHLRSGDEMARLFAHCPEVVTAAAEFGEQCAFGLSLIAPQLPPFDVPDGHTENSWLRHLVMTGARNRYGPPERASRAYSPGRTRTEGHRAAELSGLLPGGARHHPVLPGQRHPGPGQGLGGQLGGLLRAGRHQRRPVANDLLFERFLSPARDGPPDIDIDIESDLREKAIQYVYERYGRDYAAQVANVITYRGRSAVRDMARALGFSQGQQDAWSKQISRWNGLADSPDVEDIPEQVVDLAMQIKNLPRHMGIHSGGMVICDRPIADVCPVEWARMENRSVLQWDKDDCAAIGLVKFDLLGLGMLSALHYAIDLIAEHKGIEVDLQAGPDRAGGLRDAAARRLRRGVPGGVAGTDGHAAPAEAAGVLRPGRRGGADPARADPGRLGAPVHQAPQRPGARHLRPPVDGAGAAKDVGRAAVPGTAHAAGRRLRRLLRRRGRPAAPGDGLQAVHREDAPAAGPVLRRDGARHGITGEVADRIYEKLEAFANFGFPESHSLCFASLVFYSSWFKLHHPAVFCAALLRAQPMGFYSPQSLVADARRHGVVVHGPDVNASLAHATLENRGHRGSAGVRQRPPHRRRSWPSVSSKTERPTAPSHLCSI